MGRARVDVGVVTWNTRDVTLGSLKRLLDAGGEVDLRLLVRDNGSTDGTAGALAEEVPSAEVDADERNLGFAGGMNRLIERSDAPWFFALNSDAWPEPGAIEHMVAAARQWPRAAAVAPRLVRPDGSLEHSTHAFPSLRLAVAATVGPRLLGRRLANALLLEGAWSHDESRQVPWAVGAALLMRREALDDVGGFDERFFMYAEDLEWCWRAHGHGWTIRFEPAATVRHIGNVSGAQAYGDARLAAMARSADRFYRDTHGAPAATAYTALSVLGAARLWAQGAVRGDREMARFWRDQVKVHLR